MTPSTSQLSPARQAGRAARAALRGTLPERYAVYSKRWRSDFKDLAAPALRPGASVLDVGAGRRPVFSAEELPPGVSYVGLDVVSSELDAAPPGSYGEKIASDVTQRVAALEGRFDLIVSWQVLEHVRSVPDALDNFHAYLKPGGLAVISLSGRFSMFGLLNMMIPRRVGVGIVARVMRRDPATVFPALYDRCYRSALEQHTEHWSSVRILGMWAGAPYFRSVRPVQAAYVLYEEWAAASAHDNLATHYFMQLQK